MKGSSIQNHLSKTKKFKNNIINLGIYASLMSYVISILASTAYCYTISFSERQGFTCEVAQSVRCLSHQHQYLRLDSQHLLKPGIMVHVCNLMLEEGHRDRQSSQGSTILPNSDQTFIWMRLEGTLDIHSRTGGALRSVEVNRVVLF